MVSKNSWELLIVEDAQADFANLSPQVKKLVYRKLSRIQKDPLKMGKPLKTKEKLTSFDRNRIIFTLEIEEKMIHVWAIGQKDATKIQNTLIKRVNRFLR
ncbi:MAG: hypothetical protein H7A32_00335 [Deltaproteobacteria bacterium]|nr:hypothetical protein [Deltaproteobacteria bacterium]